MGTTLHANCRVLRGQTAGRGVDIHDGLEAPNWAPWLRFTPDQFEAHASLFPEGQVLIVDESDAPIAILSTSRFMWDGEVSSLPTWSEIAGGTLTFEDLFSEDGNALALMSVSIRPDVQGNGFAEMLIRAATDYAASSRITYVMSDFRPSQYGAYKARHPDAGFEHYCNLKREDGLPADAWLRALARLGMQPIRVDDRAMVVRTSASAFDGYRLTWEIDSWEQVMDAGLVALLSSRHRPELSLAAVQETWECGETGTWYVDRDANKAAYIESNLWGSVAESGL